MDTFKMNVMQAIEREKRKCKTKLDSYHQSGGVLISPISWDDLNDDRLIGYLKDWRKENQNAFPCVFTVTHSGTRKWLRELVLAREDRLLFFVKDSHDEFIGHVGVSSCDYQNKTCEVDNIVRGRVSRQSNVMSHALVALLHWICDKIHPKHISLRVFNDNTKAINLYHKLGFCLDSLCPLKKIETDDGFEWVESDTDVERFFISMKLRCENRDEP